MQNGVCQRVFLCLTLLLTFPFNRIFAQVDFNHYRPRGVHSVASAELIESLKHNLRQETVALEEAERFNTIKRLNAARSKLIVNMVENGSFIKDDSLETYVNSVLENILHSNGITQGTARVLILDSPQVNAYCFGQGIYVVTIGLLGRISSEDELAFTIAHEVAHDVLGHIKARLIRETQVSLEKKSREQITKIATGTIDVKDIEEFRSLVYGVRRHTRITEMEADSAGLFLMQEAAYDQEAALSMLTALDESLKPKFDVGADLIWPFHSTDYPLQASWFDKRLSIYSRGQTDSYLYAVDSIESHPDIGLRKKHIEDHWRNDVIVRYHQPEEFAEAVTTLAEFETLQSAYERRSYDRGIYYALQLLNRYPQNTFLISRIGQMLITLYEAKNNNDNSFLKFVPRYTAYYSDELTLVNNMLHNLSTKELGELTFHFLNNPGYFNPDDRNHYYLLWRISDLTYRKDLADEIKGMFRERFKSNIAGYYLR